MYIIGAGMAGCLAAIHFPNSVILEGNPEPTRNHFALLRMRTNRIEEMTGIKFKRIIVDKFIWDEQTYDCTQSVLPRHIINYSRKVSGVASSRSIVNLEPELRFIPPDDFHSIMLNNLEGRIKYDQKVTSITPNYIECDGGAYETGFEPTISTLPISVNMKATGIDVDYQPNIPESKTIYVRRIKLKKFNMFTTIYFPDPIVNVYRASISGDILTIESIDEPCSDVSMKVAFQAFGLDVEASGDYTILDKSIKQINGKIISLDDNARKLALFEMTKKCNLYSLGRFACWRQILLDDVVNDIKQIHKMITTHPYDRIL